MSRFLTVEPDGSAYFSEMILDYEQLTVMGKIAYKGKYYALCLIEHGHALFDRSWENSYSALGKNSHAVIFRKGKFDLNPPFLNIYELGPLIVKRLDDSDYTDLPLEMLEDVRNALIKRK
jgi:hypothetical protein